MEGAETEIFEITDFTTVSDWERFTQCLVDLFTQWKKAAISDELSAKLQFDDQSTTSLSVNLCSVQPSVFITDIDGSTCDVSYTDDYRPDSVTGYDNSKTVDNTTAGQSIIDTTASAEEKSAAAIDGSTVDVCDIWSEHDERCVFVRPSCGNDDDRSVIVTSIVQRFGVRRFVLVQIDRESEELWNCSQTLFSSFRMALLEAKWDVAVFLVLQPIVTATNPAATYFCVQGVRVAADSVTDYTDTLTARCPPHLYRLSGLLAEFRQKMCLPVEQRIIVSMRHVYKCCVTFGSTATATASAVPASSSHELSVSPSLADDDRDISLCISEFFECHPSGECVSYLQLTALWCQVCESKLMEDATHQLDPFSAETVLVRLQPDDHVQSNRHRLSSLIVFTPNTSSFSCDFGSVSHKVDDRIKVLSDAVFKDCLVEEEVNSFQYLPPSVRQWLASVSEWRRRYRLLWQFVGAATYVVTASNDSSLLHLLWCCFRERLQLYWLDVGKKLVEGIDSGPPDHSTCLFHQKLQMFNYCVEKVKSDSDPLEEEFFDASCDLDRAAVGRKDVFGDHTLMETGQPVYVPITQEMPVRTTDQTALERDYIMVLADRAPDFAANYMAKTYLSNDMAAFMAANPGAIMSDFVRWYSPADWVVPDSDGRGHLSERMTSPGNLWRLTWNQTVPRHAFQQVPLFSPVAEVENVLDYLQTISVFDILLQLKQFVAYHSVCQLLRDLSPQEVCLVKSDLVALCTLASSFTDSFTDQCYTQVYEIIWRCERKMFLYRSLTAQLGGEVVNRSLFRRLISGDTCSVNTEHASIKQRLKNMISASNDCTYNKEYVLQCECRHPSPFSARLPQRLYAQTDRLLLRLSMAIARDSVFS